MADMHKLLSGRYFLVVVITSTYCITILKCVGLVAQKLMAIETFIALFAGLSTLAGTIVYAYFDRKDREGDK